MTQIKNNIERILETGYEILFELEKEDLDLNKVKKMYDDRSNRINKLNKLPDEKIEKLTDREKESLKNLFTRVQLLEKKLNRNLSMLSEARKQDLKELSLHKKVKSFYDKTTNQNGDTRKKIVDLTTNF